MKKVILIIFLLGFKLAFAHNPDIASLMIYEQNGKSILLIKSSLTAFEGEVEYMYGKDSYKTPEAFNQLVIQHFQKNCFMVANGDTIKFSNIQVQLGHETNLFAELENVPNTINSFYVTNTMFKDMPNNKCELIVTLDGLPQQQFILDKSNQQEVNLKVEDNVWVVTETARAANFNSIFLMGAAVFLFVLLLVFAGIKRKRQRAVLKPFFLA